MYFSWDVNTQQNDDLNYPVEFKNDKFVPSFSSITKQSSSHNIKSILQSQNKQDKNTNQDEIIQPQKRFCLGSVTVPIVTECRDGWVKDVDLFTCYDPIYYEATGSVRIWIWISLLSFACIVGILVCCCCANYDTPKSRLSKRV